MGQITGCIDHITQWDPTGMGQDEVVDGVTAFVVVVLFLSAQEINLLRLGVL